jgi:L-alanine-DL-glutamate epimerase-like enolase superfamily enzyme
VIVDPIAAVEAVAVTLPLPAPVQLGSSELREREYALVRVTSAAGLVGSAYCLTRGAPIPEAVNRLLAPVLVGGDSDAIDARWEQGYRATIMSGRSGVVMRALGLVEIALWDIKGQRASMPLWRLLGGFDPAVPGLLVAGYMASGTRPEALADELASYAARGHRLIKIARIADRELMAALLQEVATRVGNAAGIVVDAGYGWSTVAEALDECLSWQLPLAWLEDPFPPERLAAYARLRERCPHPLAAGDEASATATGPLLEAGLIDYLRLDIPALGGISAALRLMVRAADAEIPVSFHIYPEISVHLAAARAQASIVESFDTAVPGGNPFDPAHLLTGVELELSDGRIHAPEQPGLGFSLTWPGEA